MVGARAQPDRQGSRGGAGRGPRVCLFTDTLGDVNGVSRFIRNVADRALETGRDLRVLTSTQFRVPEQPNIVNFPPVVAGKVPRYENLEVVVPPVRRMLAYLDSVRPDVVHISTPGPVGLVARMAAGRRGIPMVGVYHTDFPAYIDRLFDDAAFTFLCRRSMRWFYRPFTAVFTRSREYAAAIRGLGVEAERIVPLLPGIDVEAFHTRYRDPSVWDRLGVPAGVKVLSCGRVSVEKNLPFLARVWKQVEGKLRASGVAARLVVVGDGPYLEQMRRDLAGREAYFLGFRHGAELAAIYASSDLFVFPSTTDTLGQVVMESQSSGLPVIVTDAGGPKEVVEDGRTGHVLPAADPARWAAAIRGLVMDPAGRARMGAAAHESVRPRSIESSFEHYWAVHEAAHLGATPAR